MRRFEQAVAKRCSYVTCQRLICRERAVVFLVIGCAAIAIVLGLLMADSELLGDWRRILKDHQIPRPLEYGSLAFRDCTAILVPNCESDARDRRVFRVQSTRRVVAVCQIQDGLAIRTRGVRELFGRGVPLAVIPWTYIESHPLRFIAIRVHGNTSCYLRIATGEQNAWSRALDKRSFPRLEERTQRLKKNGPRLKETSRQDDQ